MLLRKLNLSGSQKSAPWVKSERTDVKGKLSCPSLEQAKKDFTATEPEL